MELSSLWDDLARSGQQPATKVMSISQEPVTGEIARKLGLPDGAQAVVLERLRYASGEPLARLRNYLPAELIPA